MTRKTKVLKARGEKPPPVDPEKERDERAQMSLYKAFILMSPLITFLMEASEIVLMSLYANHFRGYDRSVLMGCSFLYAVVAGLRSLLWGEDYVAQPEKYVSKWTYDSFLQRVPVALIAMHSRNWGLAFPLPILLIGLSPWLCVVKGVRTPKSPEISAGMVRVGDADRALFMLAMLALFLLMSPEFVSVAYPLGREKLYDVPEALEVLPDETPEVLPDEALEVLPEVLAPAADMRGFATDVMALCGMPLLHVPAILGLLAGCAAMAELLSWESLGGLFFLATSVFRRRVPELLATPSSFLLLATSCLVALVVPFIVPWFVEAPMLENLEKEFLSGQMGRQQWFWVAVAFSCGFVIGFVTEILYIVVGTRGGALSRVLASVAALFTPRYLPAVGALLAVSVGIYVSYSV